MTRKNTNNTIQENNYHNFKSNDPIFLFKELKAMYEIELSQLAQVTNSQSEQKQSGVQDQVSGL